MEDFFDEFTASEDSLVGNVVLPSTAEFPNGSPTSQASDQAAPLELRPVASGDPVCYKLAIASPGRLLPRAELVEHILHGLPWPVDSAHEDAVAGPWVAIKSLEI
jgi:hypothetical protein